MDEFDVSGFVSDIIEVALKKDKTRERSRIYRENNKDKIKQKKKEYCEKNKDKKKEYDKTRKKQRKEYRQTPNGIKSNRISQWKHKGIITDDYDELYNHYLKTAYCDACKVELTYDRNPTATTKCCDHDHSITDRHNFRNILCNLCNIKRR